MVVIMETRLLRRFTRTRTQPLTRWVRNGSKDLVNPTVAGTSNRKLRGIVVSQAMLYEIDSDGNITVIGKRDEVL